MAAIPTLLQIIAGLLCATIARRLRWRAERIRCPTLQTWAENDPLATNTEAFFNALRCPKTQIRFTAAEAAGEHCEMMNRWLLNDRVLDWLDGLLVE